MANRGGFSWKRALGVSAAKSKISRKIGIPLSKSGRQRKTGAAMGCTTFILVIVLLVSVTVISLAHSGRTDANGGHRDRKHGTYHYHHGYPAHDHPNGVCPYEKKNDKN